MRISDWSSDVCSSDLRGILDQRTFRHGEAAGAGAADGDVAGAAAVPAAAVRDDHLTAIPGHQHGAVAGGKPAEAEAGVVAAVAIDRDTRAAADCHLSLSLAADVQEGAPAQERQLRAGAGDSHGTVAAGVHADADESAFFLAVQFDAADRKSTRLNSSH